MKPLTRISIITLNSGSEGNEPNYGAAVTFPGEKTEIRSLKEWRDRVQIAEMDKGKRNEPYIGLMDAITSEWDKFKGVNPSDNLKAKDTAGQLVELAINGDINTLFLDDKGDPYIRAYHRDHFEIMPVNKSLKKWLGYQFYTKMGKMPGAEAIESAINILIGKATYDGGRYPLFIRVAEDETAYWYYLSDDRRRAVRIDENGWEVVDEPPILFKHFTHMLPQDEPIRADKPGYLDRFLDLLNYKGNDRELFKIMLVVDLVPGIPQLGLNLIGLPGSAKTTAIRLEKKLIDPSSVDIISMTNDEDELIRIFAKHHIIGFDNVSSISRDRGDLLCQGVTGAAMTARTKYTDDDDFIRSFKVIIRLNGISNEAKKSDLLERLAIFELERIDEDSRRDEGDVKDEFDKIRPFVLAELFDLLAKTLRVKNSLTGSRPPRMADWYHWAEAVAVAMGKDQAWFAELFSNYEARQNDEAIDQSPLGTLIEGLVRERRNGRLGPFVGTATDLLSTLKARAIIDGINTRGKDWPSDGSELGKQIKPLIKNLETHGVQITRGHTFADLMKLRPDLTKSVTRDYRPQDRMIVIEEFKKQVDNGIGTGKEDATCSKEPASA